MKIRRWESREVNVLVEYNIDADTIKEAVDKLESIDGTDAWLQLEKEIVESEPLNNYIHDQCAWIDDKNYWHIEKTEWIAYGDKHDK